MSKYGERTQFFDKTVANWGKQSSALTLSGGQETVTTGGYRYIVFNTSGDLTVSARSYGVVEVLTIGGGGSGCLSSGSGGGAEIDYWTSCVITSNVIVTIGAGALGTANVTSGLNGGSTSFGNFITTLGGGGGGGHYSAGLTGGSSGGGGGGAVTTSPAGTGNNTNAGGSGLHLTSGGGGGGAGGAGTNSTATGSPPSGQAGSGGAGLLMSTIDANLTAANFPTTMAGMTRFSAGGGGGQSLNYGGSPTAGVGGTGGGGNGGRGPNQVQGTAGSSYGSGGGGNGYDTSGNPGTGYNGFKGLCVVRFAIP